jgi:hypothetical protein
VLPLWKFNSMLVAISPRLGEAGTGVLMGALAGIMETRCDVLRAGGQSPSKAFNETAKAITKGTKGVTGRGTN